jgi:nicotinate-nucleotide adenylyltransferase
VTGGSVTGERIGVLGGTFDPIHIGHLAVAEDAACALRLNRVLFMPNKIPPHKHGQHVTDVEDRIAMVRAAVEDNPRFELSLIEMERSGPSYTLDTMRLLRDRFGASTQLYFLVGCDALTQLHTWHEPDTLLQEFRLAVMERPIEHPVDWDVIEQRFPDIRAQVETVPVAHLDISGADLRERVREGRPIRYQVVPAVERYIAERGLYRGDSRA